ncbi:MAG TPA: FAD-dependent oxidoreductase, partial [Actinomycetota bacterium]|nr:FAD-dependent oxidoreductase [Actinomycetota bacterium]
MEVDVAVVGGGPAGAVAARCLASWGRRVAIVERSRYCEPRYGETLPPEAMPLLDALGLREEVATVDAVESPGTVSSWGGDPVESDFVRNVHGAGLHVDRTGFDRALARAAEGAGASLSTGVSVTGVARARGGWRVTTSGATLTARFVVDAAGRNSHVVAGRRTVQRDKLLALTALARHRRGRPLDLRTYVETTPRGWWYTAPVGASETVSMFFTDAEEHRRGVSRSRELETAPLTRSRLAGADVVDERVLPVTSGLRGRVAGPGWIAVGDSASSFDPVSGAGIHKALGQGALAAAAVHAALDGDTDAP